MNPDTRKIEELTEGDYQLSYGRFDTMSVEVLPNRKRKIALDAVGCSLSELLAFLSKVQ